MKIYTKTGDDGTTGLFAGGRVKKCAARVEAYGTVDELNSALGVAIAAEPGEELAEILTTIQHDLFVVGADLATPRKPGRKPSRALRLDESRVSELELVIDRLEADLPPLTAFILPGGSLAGAHVHLARTICRRAERRAVALTDEEIIIGSEVVEYLNRLSDLLFVAARWVNHNSGQLEVEWKGQ